MTSTSMTGSSRHGRASCTAFSAAIWPASWNAMSEESTVW